MLEMQRRPNREALRHNRTQFMGLLTKMRDADDGMPSDEEREDDKVLLGSEPPRALPLAHKPVGQPSKLNRVSPFRILKLVMKAVDNHGDDVPSDEERILQTRSFDTATTVDMSESVDDHPDDASGEVFQLLDQPIRRRGVTRDNSIFSISTDGSMDHIHLEDMIDKMRAQLNSEIIEVAGSGDMDAHVYEAPHVDTDYDADVDPDNGSRADSDSDYNVSDRNGAKLEGDNNDGMSCNNVASKHDGLPPQQPDTVTRIEPVIEYPTKRIFVFDDKNESKHWLPFHSTFQTRRRARRAKSSAGERISPMVRPVESRDDIGFEIILPRAGTKDSTQVTGEVFDEYAPAIEAFLHKQPSHYSDFGPAKSEIRAINSKEVDRSETIDWSKLTIVDNAVDDEDNDNNIISEDDNDATHDNNDVNDINQQSKDTTEQANSAETSPRESEPTPGPSFADMGASTVAETPQSDADVKHDTTTTEDDAAIEQWFREIDAQETTTDFAFSPAVSPKVPPQAEEEVTPSFASHMQRNHIIVAPMIMAPIITQTPRKAFPSFRPKEDLDVTSGSESSSHTDAMASSPRDGPAPIAPGAHRYTRRSPPAAFRVEVWKDNTKGSIKRMAKAFAAPFRARPQRIRTRRLAYATTADGTVVHRQRRSYQRSAHVRVHSQELRHLANPRTRETTPDPVPLASQQLHYVPEDEQVQQEEQSRHEESQPQRRRHRRQSHRQRLRQILRQRQRRDDDDDTVSLSLSDSEMEMSEHGRSSIRGLAFIESEVEDVHQDD